MIQLAALLLTTLLLEGAAGQARDRADTGRTGRLAGRVTAADTGRPIARALVSLTRANETKSAHTATTDKAGAFAFDGVTEGRYTVLATRRGLYLDAYYGGTTPDTPPSLVSISAEGTTRVEIQMLRAGVIAGHVFDEAGDPLPYATVVLAPPSGSGALLKVAPMAAFSPTGDIQITVGPPIRVGTNDRGEYRFFGLMPGEYVLYATTPAYRFDVRRYAPIYYPGVLDSAAATRIQISPGQEIANADFTMRLVPTLTVSGVVLAPEGHPAPGGTLALQPATAEPDGVPSQIATIKPDGSFTFEAIPGQYLLRARAGDPARSSANYRGSLSMAQPLAIGETDISGLVLRLTSGATLRGRIVFEGSARPVDPKGFRISVPTGGLGAIDSTNGATDGGFTLRGIESGPRRLYASGPAGWTLKGIYINGQDVSDTPIDFRDNTLVDEVLVVFTDVKTPVTVSVQYPDAEKSSVVLVFSNDPAHWSGRRVAARAAAVEPISIEGLPAGDYLAVALTDVPLSALSRGDANLLGRLKSMATKFQLTEGVPESIQLRAMPLPR